MAHDLKKKNCDPNAIIKERKEWVDDLGNVFFMMSTVRFLFDSEFWNSFGVASSNQ